MKNKFWRIIPVIAVLIAALLLAVSSVAYFDSRLFAVEMSAAAVIILCVCGYLFRMRRNIRSMIQHAVRSLNTSDKETLEIFPLPAVLVSKYGEIIWYNDMFRDKVLPSDDMYGANITTLTGGIPVEEMVKTGKAEINCGQRKYTVYAVSGNTRDSAAYTLYYIENTELKRVAEEYMLSRPTVMMIYIDNMDDLLQNARDSERAQISGRVETMLEDWISSTSGMLRKYSTERFLVVMEQRHLQSVIVRKFDILDMARKIQAGDNRFVTLSIGVGHGDTLREGELLARQALEMALGRGGDQAAIRTKDGFDFYGGISQGVEKRNKVRTRVVASAMIELIDSSDLVLIMGHVYSDFDCLGSAAALVSATRSIGKNAYAVVRHGSTVAPELLERYEQSNRSDMFIEPSDAMKMMTRKTLLIITDTHNPKMLESRELYQAASSVAVIDHHRKMVDHIDNAVIFYHEPFASSASEMVAELIQYMKGSTITRLDAEALLAGIILDTRGFVMKSGSRTFEAAAYLKRFGADTVEVKRMFSGSMELFRVKTDLISLAEMYRNTAISVYDETCPDAVFMRVAASQAANELLYIKGVDASFVMFSDGNATNISARSLGGFNVQLIMEKLGGGGHLAMAGAQLQGKSIRDAYDRLTAAIDGSLQNSPAVESGGDDEV